MRSPTFNLLQLDEKARSSLTVTSIGFALSRTGHQVKDVSTAKDTDVRVGAFKFEICSLAFRPQGWGEGRRKYEKL